MPISSTISSPNLDEPTTGGMAGTGLDYDTHPLSPPTLDSGVNSYTMGVGATGTGAESGSEAEPMENGRGEVVGDNEE